MTTRRRVIQSGAAFVTAAALPAPAIAQNAGRNVLRVVPHANLTVIDPIWTTAYITRNGSFMVWDTVRSGQAVPPAAADGRRLHAVLR
jgi:peptide/nickel transport system substrate-binding protein